MTHRTTARHGLAGAAMLGLLGARSEREDRSGRGRVSRKKQQPDGTRRA